jgi:ferric-dicitrate binding protein FerR (iron transport regulator)
MTTVFVVPRVSRPLDEAMFADLGIPHVDLEAVTGGIQVTVPIDLTPEQVLRGRIRLLTSNAADEATLVGAIDAMAVLDQIQAQAAAYAAIPAPTSAQAVAATKTLASAVAQIAGYVHALIEWDGRDALDLH